MGGKKIGKEDQEDEEEPLVARCAVVVSLLLGLGLVWL